MASTSIYLVRHAIAAERGAAWPDDGKRPLTRKGVARMRDIARGLVALDVAFDVVVTSPLVRAQETAEVLVAAQPRRPLVSVSTALSPDQSPLTVAGMLSRHGRARHVALVGHAPGLGVFAAWLIGAAEPIPFKKGGVARIDVPQLPPLSGTGTLVWAATPRMLRALA